MSDLYEGWRNRETWLVGVWIDNTSQAAAYWNDRTREEIKNAEDNRVIHLGPKEQAAIALAEILKSDLEDKAEALELEADPLGDLLSTAIQRADYYEVARFLVDEEILQRESNAKAK